MSMGLDRKPQVRRTTPPSESVVASWYENASLLDSYSIDLSASEQSSMRELATRTLVSPPAWQKALIALRWLLFLIVEEGPKFTAARRDLRKTI